MDWQRELAAEISGEVLTDESSRTGVATDFGRIYERKPAVVVRPGSAEDVANVLAFAGRRSLGITVRGAGHSQSGQSLSEQVVLDMRALDQVLRIDTQRCSVVCQAGSMWRALLQKVLPLGLSPPVLTNNLDVTVGGTLSTAGIGVASWKRGTQADHCLELKVVTGQGEIVRCSPEQQADLFDAVRGGLGQFAVIAEVTLKLRRHKPRFRSFYLLYDRLEAVLADLKLMMDEGRFDYLESWCAPLPQGFGKTDGQTQLLAQWFFPLHAIVETDGLSEPSAATALNGLEFYKHVHTEDGEIQDFFGRLDPLFGLWKRGGFWEYAHPWMECILPWAAAGSYISRVLQSIPPQILQGGHILLWPARGSSSSVPLFIRPEGERLLGFGILVAVPKPALSQVLPLLDQASVAAIQMGGKRYLSGWLSFDAVGWRSHYGPQWPAVASLKRRYDPCNVLNPSFLSGERG